MCLFSAGEMLSVAEHFLEQQMHPTVVISAYRKALDDMISTLKKIRYWDQRLVSPGGARKTEVFCGGGGRLGTSPGLSTVVLYARRREEGSRGTKDNDTGHRADKGSWVQFSQMSSGYVRFACSPVRGCHGKCVAK